MIQHLPNYYTIFFGLTTLFALVLFFRVVDNAKKCEVNINSANIIIAITFWLILQAFLSFKNIYSKNVDMFPPFIALFGTIPTFITIALLFVTKKGRVFIDALPTKHLTQIHLVRIPVEIMFYLLLLQKAIPQIMTFTGFNFDILAGLSVIIILYLAFKKRTLSNKALLTWNIISLLLLINIIVIAVLSAPTPMQVFGLEQPNIAILHFPYSFLPTFIAPLVLLSHLIVIRRLVLNQPIHADE